jgi:Bacterial protein of unknown function (Gcw_chp)
VSLSGTWRRTALVVAAMAGPSAASSQVVLTTDAGAFNAYVWRGVTLTNQVVLQPDAYLSIPAGGGSAVVGVWGTIEAGRYDDPANDLSEGGGTSSLNATEVNVWAEYGHSLGSKLNGTLGSLLYLYPNESGLTNDVNRTLEIYAKLQLVSPLSPKLSAWYDVDKVDGLYLEGSLSQTVAGIPGLPITLGALAGLSAGQGINQADPAEIANFGKNTLTHVDLSATGALGVGPVTVSPTVHLLILNDDFARITKPGVAKDAKAWAGVSLSWSKALTGAAAASE